MRALIQRVSEASVTIAGEVVGQIGPGLLIFLGVRLGDTLAEAEFLADKCLICACFEDAAGKMNLSSAEARRDAGCHQFTLYGDLAGDAGTVLLTQRAGDIGTALYEHLSNALPVAVCLWRRAVLVRTWRSV